MRIVSTLSALLFLCIGCDRLTPLRDYEGHWILDSEFQEQQAAQSNLSPEIRQKITEYYGLDRLQWFIENGNIYSESSDNQNREPIVKEIFEDNINFAEILVSYPERGHCVLRLELRNDFLNIYTNPHRFLFLRFKRFENDGTNK